MKNILLTFIACGCTCCLQAMSNPTDASAGGAKKNKPEAKVPLVYPVEHTGSSYALPSMPTYDGLPEVRNLPDPLEWSNGSGRVASFADWSRRRSEIAAEIQHYGIGTKPSVPKDAVHAYMDADTLVVNVTVNGHTLRLRSEIRYPKTGQPPYALMIGTSGIALPKQLFEGRPIATMVFHEDQVNDYSQWRKHKERGQHNFDRLYPQLKDNGAYSEWAWGLSRLIDGLQQLGPANTKIDMNHIGVTGCSYAGKMALFCGAFDERIALTIAQEPGGGGAAAWRISHQMDSVECLEKTDYHWFLESMRTPDYKWLADRSALVSARAAREVWKTFGIADRMGYSIVAGHPHCMLPESQYPEVSAFIDKFLLGKATDTENVEVVKGL